MDLYLLNCLHLKLSFQLVLSSKQVMYRTLLTQFYISPFPSSPFIIQLLLLTISLLCSQIFHVLTSPLSCLTSSTLPRLLSLTVHSLSCLLYAFYAFPLSTLLSSVFSLPVPSHAFLVFSVCLSIQSLFYLFPLFVPPFTPSSLLSYHVSFCFLTCSLLFPSLFPTPSCHRSVVTAMVRNNVNTVVDIEKIFVQLNGTQSRLTGDNQVSVWVE